MSRSTKHIVLLLLVGALVSLVILAAGLPNLQLHSGIPFPGSSASNDDAQPVTSAPSARAYSIPVLRGVIALVFLISMFYLPARLIARANLKIIFRLLLVLVALIILAYLLPTVTPVQPAYIPDESIAITPVPPFAYSLTPIGQPPQILIWLVTTGLVLGIGVLIFALMKRRIDPDKVETELLQQAEDAVDALQSGLDLKSVVTRCYLQMTHALQKEQGLERNDTMTAREFEHWLEQKGFPTIPVRQLTSLFEKVRYSKQPTSNDDEKVAIARLNEIIQFCRDGKV